MSYPGAGRPQGHQQYQPPQQQYQQQYQQPSGPPPPASQYYNGGNRPHYAAPPGYGQPQPAYGAPSGPPPMSYYQQGQQGGFQSNVPQEYSNMPVHLQVSLFFFGSCVNDKGCFFDGT